MSYDLAVWEGTRPATEAEAVATYERIMARMETGSGVEPTAAIRGYVAALLARWPDITDPAGEDSPWADGPMSDNADGDAIYFSMVWSRCEEASEFAAQLAQQHGLVCFDPQAERLRPEIPTTSRIAQSGHRARSLIQRLFGRR